MLNQWLSAKRREAIRTSEFEVQAANFSSLLGARRPLHEGARARFPDELAAVDDDAAAREHGVGRPP